ncbi:ATP-binding cassette sub-family G member 1-like [Cimex lectularius]|uniref:ABC transporter domain-containing protein n=1 Tax=Cimex lectularius TaxID=79782 RepID=A0A8I6TJK0_CIMLE|nr:ATP-binding cassette sub-family G member 1-like [Cimex lectularius]
MRPTVDIEFSDLSYTAGRRRIMKGVSGSFRAGQLTAIMGPSGAGKSTLMNILAGYVTVGVNGIITTNGEPRNLANFNKMSVYIMQEDLLQPYLTVRESMELAARLKLGSKYSSEQIFQVVDDLLTTLGLCKCADNWTNRLSGGQRKRVSVALEIVHNPPVIFLDEPTTGLDIVTINQTVQLLRLLAKQGRTVVCTIHQPSASLFHLFDRVYMLARGKCIYQGVPGQLVPFLSSTNLECPQNYNPADYILEVLQVDIIDKLCESIQNGKVVKAAPLALCEIELAEKTKVGIHKKSDFLTFPNSFWTQFVLIFSRMILQKKRHVAGLWLQFIHHLFSGLIIGLIFRGVGNDASRPFDNFKFILCVSVFFMYTHCMTPILTYPLEIKIMKREFFNRWYSLKAYYLAKTLSTLPLIISLGFVFTCIVYVMSDQPLELKRFSWFSLNCGLIALTSEGLGILIGFTFKCKNGTVVGPSVMAPILMIAMHGMGWGQKITDVMKVIMKFSYLRFSLVSMITALYLDNRVMECKDKSEPYCHYGNAKLLVRDLAMDGGQPAPQIIGVISYLVLFRILAYLALRYRCSTEYSNKIFLYLTKILKRR